MQANDVYIIPARAVAVVCSVVTGKVKEQAGKATGDESLEAEGHADQAKGDVKNAGEKIKDVFKK